MKHKEVDIILSWKPFLHRFTSYDGKDYFHKFCCPKCGSDSCVSLTYDGHIDPFFWQGYYMCYRCGQSVTGGKSFSYAHDCFYRVPISSVVQLEFNF